MTDTLTMEATTVEDVASEKPRALTEKELAWAQFIRDLQPWELHKLLMMGEMELHDWFVDGKRTLMSIFADICIEGEENTYSKKV